MLSQSSTETLLYQQSIELYGQISILYYETMTQHFRTYCSKVFVYSRMTNFASKDLQLQFRHAHCSRKPEVFEERHEWAAETMERDWLTELITANPRRLVAQSSKQMKNSASSFIKRNIFTISGILA
jgi:hypothetical protein